MNIHNAGIRNAGLEITQRSTARYHTNANFIAEKENNGVWGVKNGNGYEVRGGSR